jgi:hypothetical protein
MYQYTDPKMQEVAKFCEKGFWPICKNERGEFAVFTPILTKVLNKGKAIRRSSWNKTKEEAKEEIGKLWHNDCSLEYSIGQELQPTEIVSFYHPPTPKFEVGDKVRIREDIIEALDMQLNNSVIAGKTTEIGDIKNGIAEVRIEGVYYDLPFNAFELVLETKPETVTFQVITNEDGKTDLTITKEQWEEIKKILGK